jgi:hypothetical protein
MCLFMMISSHPPATSVRFVSPLSTSRVYRLVDAQSNPHPILDDHYETHEAAWAEALRWWNLQDPTGQYRVEIGVEVSTSNGGWRTIRHPCA